MNESTLNKNKKSIREFKEIDISDIEDPTYTKCDATDVKDLNENECMELSLDDGDYIVCRKNNKAIYYKKLVYSE